jgi:hypothetical protein
MCVSIFQCASHWPISVADLGWSIHRVKPLYYRVYKMCILWILLFFGGGECTSSAPTPPFVCANACPSSLKINLGLVLYLKWNVIMQN